MDVYDGATTTTTAELRVTNMSRAAPWVRQWCTAAAIDCAQKWFLMTVGSERVVWGIKARVVIGVKVRDRVRFRDRQRL